MKLTPKQNSMKYLKYFILLFIFAVIVSMVMNYVIKSNTPDFILSKLKELKTNDVLMDSIGGYDKFEYSFNKNDYKYKDTVKYSILIIGNKKVLTFQGVQWRESKMKWRQIDERLIID